MASLRLTKSSENQAVAIQANFPAPLIDHKTHAVTCNRPPPLHRRYYRQCEFATAINRVRACPHPTRHPDVAGWYARNQETVHA